ncbi:DUF636 domain-containing protein [Coprinopsis sp. MPI-PUGE-AT-0042]|nr:DUF636 domain-containing protein [Coprinopsis sp. MPI-PUGE-AT-0042]
MSHSPQRPGSPVQTGKPYPTKFPGSCYCHEIEFTVELNAPEKEARTSICYCQNCRKWTGSAFGITTKVPKSSFKVTKGETKKHESDNGSGTKLYREFCGTCGGGILEYGACPIPSIRVDARADVSSSIRKENAGEHTYICYGAFDDPFELPPKGAFFCKYRESWMPELPGLFHKQEIKN